MASLNNKAVMGIGTLIIFIATILVAAVAAAVLISTSNVLQQRSLLVGQDARKVITDGIDVISILSASDSIEESFNDFEILIRLSPGSDALQMRNFNLQYIGPNFDQAANLAYNANQTSVQIGALTTTHVSVFDLDEDGETDSVGLVLNAYGSNEGLIFNLSSEGNSSVIDLGEDLAAAGTSSVNINMDETGIFVGDNYFGSVLVTGTTGTNDQIDASVNLTVREFAGISECDFDVLPEEEFYCYQVANGNTDFILSSGERFKLLYRLDESNEITVGEDFTFIFTTEKGRLSEARARTPDVVTTTKTKLWPIG